MRSLVDLSGSWTSIKVIWPTISALTTVIECGGAYSRVRRAVGVALEHIPV
jgi:hypothetical protein